MRLAALAAAVASCSGGDGGGGTNQGPTVTAVVITSPPAAPTFGALTRTVQFAAEARDASGAVVSGAFINWSTSAPTVAAVSGTGLVTAQGNGTAQIRAISGTIQSSPVTVTVNQVPVAVAITPATVIFGALGSNRQLAAVVSDSAAQAVSGAAVVWSRAGPGTSASVSAGGLVNSIAVGAVDTAVATSGSLSAKAPIIVNQAVALITISAPAGDSVLRTTGRTRQFSAAAQDSNGNALPSPPFTWTSLQTGTATVDNTGLVAAVSDGAATIQAALGAITGSRTQVVQRYAETFSFNPPNGSITTSGGTVAFAGTAQDSSGAGLAIAWSSKNTALVTVAPASGANTTASAAAQAFGPDSTFVVIQAGGRRDSARVSVNIPVSFSANVQPIFTANCALAGCHTGPAPTGPGLNLSSGQAYGNLVGIATAGGPPGSIRVIAGDADNSYIIRKLEGGPNINGVRMPFGGPFLPQATINVIRAWISQGANNN